MFGFTKAEADAARFVADVLAEERGQPPTTLAERNLRQLLLVERVQRQFWLDRVDALCVVARVFGATFPH